MIRNQSTIDQIPHPPHVKSLPTPRPTCPKIKRSIYRRLKVSCHVHAVHCIYGRGALYEFIERMVAQWKN